MENQKKNKEVDPFLKLKHIAYCIASPPFKTNDASLEAFVKYARHQICVTKNILYFDPIWDSYSDEQVLVEYYALRFEKDKDFLEQFEVEVINDGKMEDDIDWMEKEIAKNKTNVEEYNKIKDEIEEFEDTPDSLGKE